MNLLLEDDLPLQNLLDLKARISGSSCDFGGGIQFGSHNLRLRFALDLVDLFLGLHLRCSFPPEGCHPACIGLNDQLPHTQDRLVAALSHYRGLPLGSEQGYPLVGSLSPLPFLPLLMLGQHSHDYLAGLSLDLSHHPLSPSSQLNPFLFL